MGAIYALMSMGLTLIFGVLRVVNFAHGEFLMLGMYIAWFVYSVLGWNSYLALLIVVPLLTLFGSLVYFTVIRPSLGKPELVVVFATMGLSILMQNGALMVMSADLYDIPAIGDGKSIAIGEFRFRAELLIGFAVTLILTMFLKWLVNSTYIGKAIRATVQDREAAALMGIPVRKMFLITFSAGSALVGFASCIMLPLFPVFPTLGLNFVLIAFVVVVLGGMGSLEGALLGGIAIGVVQVLSSYYIAPAYGQLFFFIVFVLVLIFRPTGLMGLEGSANLGEE